MTYAAACSSLSHTADSIRGRKNTDSFHDVRSWGSSKKVTVTAPHMRALFEPAYMSCRETSLVTSCQEHCRPINSQEGAHSQLD